MTTPLLPKGFQDLALYYQSTIDGETEGMFHIPTTRLMTVLNEWTRKTDQLQDELIQTHSIAMEYVQAKHETTQQALQKLQERFKAIVLDELLKRHAFAVEQTYQLQFQIDKQQQEKKIPVTGRT